MTTPVPLTGEATVQATVPAQTVDIAPAVAQSVPPTTTLQEDLVTAGQRHINVMWEGTQRNIAQEVTIVALVVTAFLVMWPGIPLELRLMAYTTLSNVFFAVTSVYFTRTNHTKVGGVSPNQTGR